MLEAFGLGNLKDFDVKQFQESIPYISMCCDSKIIRGLFRMKIKFKQ